MNIQIEQERLIKALSQIIGVVEKRQTLPILGNVYLKLSAGELVLIGSDLETEITTRVSNVNGTDGEITVSARKLFDIARALASDAMISLDVEENKMVVKAGKSRFSLQTLAAQDYPILDASNWNQEFSITQKELNTLLSKTSFSMAQQDVRYFLNGMLLEIKPQVISTVATDGHRLAKSELSNPDINIDLLQCIIPRKAVLEIAKFLDAESDNPVQIKLNAGHVSVQTDNFVFVSKLIDGRFPDYEKVIPQNLTKHITLDRSSMIDVLSRAAILSNEKFRGVSLLLENNSLKVSSNNPDQEHASDEMEVAYADEQIEVAFNVNYLLEALKACESEQVILSLQDSKTSCTFQETEAKETLYLIMPMRL